jgi:murein DD-endopeptidase MepM/ murein hydrolase activator NlpD
MSSHVRISWFPEEPKQGEILHLRVSGPDGIYVEKGEIDARPLHFFSASDRTGQWDALFGIDARQTPGEYEMRIWLASSSESAGETRTAQIRILPEQFPEERLTLPDAKVHLSPENLARVKKEQKKISSLWSEENSERRWKGPFMIPVEGRPGSPFGVRRWINEEPRSFHTGMDIKAAEGKPVQASNHGRVVLVGDFFFGGRSVFVDHGQGVYTMYFHLSETRVVEGQEVTRGDVLGLVGKTGRATGPHLHWGVRFGGARVDPASLVDRTQGLL